MRASLAAPLLLCLLSTATATAAKGLPEPVTAALELARTDRSRAIAQLDRALTEVRGADRTWVLLHLAEQHRLAGHSDQARQRFVDTLGEPKSGTAHEAARLGLTLLDAADGIDARTLQNLISIAEDAALDTQNADRFLLLAVRASEGDGGDPAAHARRATSYAERDPELARRVAERVAGLRTTGTVTVTHQGAGGVGAVTLSGEDAAWREARRALASGDPQTARAQADRVRELTTNPERKAALSLLDQAIAGEAIHWDRYGVLLPLSGRYGGVGTRLREAIEHGWAEGGGQGQLVFADSGGTAEGAAAALHDLVVKQGVIAVLGPAIAGETDVVTRNADTMGVPLVAMSQTLEEVGDFEWVFQAWLTQRQQVDALLTYAFAHDLKRFAVFAPDSDYGQRAADLFTAAVSERGGSIAARVDYEAETTNHLPFARKLKEKAPSLDFDAIFLPENATKVPIAAAALAYEEIGVGRFDPSNAHDPVPLIGLSGWNHYSVIPAGGKYTLDALFTDVYVPPPERGGVEWSPSPSWRAFTDRFTAAVGHAPTPIEALAVDAGAMLAAAARSGARTRLELRDALIEAVPTTSPTGAQGFDPETRLLRRRVEVLSVKPSGFFLAD